MLDNNRPEPRYYIAQTAPCCNLGSKGCQEFPCNRYSLYDGRLDVTRNLGIKNHIYRSRVNNEGYLNFAESRFFTDDVENS